MKKEDDAFSFTLSSSLNSPAQVFFFLPMNKTTQASPVNVTFGGLLSRPWGGGRPSLDVSPALSAVQMNSRAEGGPIDLS